MINEKGQTISDAARRLAGMPKGQSNIRWATTNKYNNKAVDVLVINNNMFQPKDEKLVTVYKGDLDG